MPRRTATDSPFNILTSAAAEVRPGKESQAGTQQNTREESPDRQKCQGTTSVVP